jgi:hypothetical protein
LIEDPSDGAPSRRRFRPRARRKNEPLTLPVATPPGRSPPPPPGPLPPPLRQKRWVSRPEAPSLDKLPARRSLSRPPRTRTRHRTGGFATRGRLPTLFRPSLHEDGLDPAAFASSSLASARCHAPLVDFCNRNDPQARLRIEGTRFPISRDRSRDHADTEVGPSAPFGVTKPSCHGSGAGKWSLGSRLATPAPLAALARTESLAPTRLARTPPVADPRPGRPEWPIR